MPRFLGSAIELCRRASLLLALALAACSDQGPQTDEFEENRERWRESRPEAYVYAVERLCFCGDAGRGPVRVWVLGNTAQERRYVEGGAVVNGPYADLFPTVEGLFEIIQEAIPRAHELEVTYDPVSGVPVDFWIDYSANIADEELGFRVTEPVQAWLQAVHQ